MDSPDKYCYTMPDGECVSEDPRCPHNQGIIVDEKSESVDEYLDREDLNRMEWDRLQEDLHPHQTPADENRPPHIHRDTDAIQSWMRDQRRANSN